ncbi:hypothetical protein BGZ95_010235 [Linnemannia exigua]|uniref:C3H1-type domain-containing protein n=1 Tax=Linnemannia exigua TaxID=604196 RepID=A0AAD4DBT5_9FUNG|nr:hypothetical protein BGZ95_010235 [Linnemannia exigua]
MSTQQCQFFLTKKGCRNGASCRFSHNNQPASTGSTGPATEPSPSNPTTPPPAPTPARKRVVTAARQPVRKPVPASLQNINQESAAASLRSFEISQVSSRFASTFSAISSPTINNENKDDDTFELKIVPSDPDFPYEISALHVLLAVPKSYPTQPCSVSVLNRDIPKGFSTNLERGFAQAAQQQKSLLAHLNWLDVNMEQLLQKPPAPTIRFIGHANNNNNSLGRSSTSSDSSGVSTSPLLPPPLPSVVPQPTPSSMSKNKKDAANTQLKPPQSQPQRQQQPPRQQTPPPLPPPPPIQKTFTPAEREQANLQRQKQMNQIQARFRSSFESLSPTCVKISLDSTDKEKMPVKWQGPLWIELLVPALYPLEPCDIRLRENGNNPEIEIWRARNVEQGFRKIVATMPQLSLFQLLNQLNRDLKDLMNLPAPITSPTPPPLQTTPSPSPPTQPAPSTPTPKETLLLGQGSSRPSAIHFDERDRADHKGKVIYVDAPQETRRGNFDTIHDHGAITSDDESSGTDEEEEESDEDHSDHATSYHHARPTSGDEDESEHEDEEEEDEEEEPGVNTGPLVESGPKRGIEIRMPDLKLDHISLLYCRSLSLLVRCNRCKALVDMPELVPDDSSTTPSSQGHTGTADRRKWRTCENCQSLLGAHFRTEYIHIQSRSIGYLDLAGCTAYDILPSAFVPTCGECDHVHGSGADEHSLQQAVNEHGTTTDGHGSYSTDSVGRGMSATANCRKCHVRMTFTMEGEIKFVKLSPGDLMKASASDLDLLPLKKKKPLKNKNGLEFELKVGEPLPRKGACDHYKKSRRWFRFPCCSKIYACHLCHDEKESDSHESEFAKRMICGHCSREQTVSDKPCVCGKTPMKTAGGSGAFWEGGEGMRDRTKMSNKDSRKHKGLAKTVAKKTVGAENIRKRAPKV